MVENGEASSWGDERGVCWWNEEHGEMDKGMPFHGPSLDG